MNSIGMLLALLATLLPTLVHGNNQTEKGSGVEAYKALGYHEVEKSMTDDDEPIDPSDEPVQQSGHSSSDVPLAGMF